MKSLVLVVLVAGCTAHPVKYDYLLPGQITLVKKHPGTVRIETAGGRESGVWRGQISNDALKQALARSITESQLFSKVVEGGAADYVLTVEVTKIDQSRVMLASNYTVGIEAGWRLTRGGSGVAAWQESIKSEHTTRVTDGGVSNFDRQRMALEGAARNNIQIGLAKISAIDL